MREFPTGAAGGHLEVWRHEGPPHRGVEEDVVLIAGRVDLSRLKRPTESAPVEALVLMPHVARVGRQLRQGACLQLHHLRMRLRRGHGAARRLGAYTRRYVTTMMAGWLHGFLRVRSDSFLHAAVSPLHSFGTTRFCNYTVRARTRARAVVVHGGNAPDRMRSRARAREGMWPSAHLSLCRNLIKHLHNAV